MVIFLAVLMLILSSCADSPPLPDDHYYRLPWTHTVLPEARLTEGDIFVPEFIADGLYRERPLIHADDRHGNDLVQYHYHLWIDSPARILQDQLIRYLAESHAATRIVDTPDITADLSIQGKIRAFERHVYGNTDEVNVRLEFRVEQTGNRNTLLITDYNVQVDVRDHSINGVVDAFGTALSQVFSHLLDDARNNIVH